jgi:hypothetical protein
MSYNEASGPALNRDGKKKAQLHHLTISPSSTEEKPGWIVSHFKTERDRSPVEHHFSDGTQLMQHIADAANVPPPQDEERD